jgi:NAD(P)-dependent dehydrogenase (short-subunit alcohol dehydrogenase family)
VSEVVVVTGSTSGVGRAIAHRFAKEGAQVALLARNRAGLEAAAKEVEELGGRALAIPTDVASYDAVEAAASAVEETLGPIDVWVNNAMTTIFAFLDDIEPDEFRRATEVTYLGTVWGTKAALERMQPRDRGTIVMVGSAMAYRGIPLQAPYCGAKHAIKGFWESLRTELLHKGSHIRTPMVQLPGLNTPQFDHCRSKMDRYPMPVPPIYQPEIAADAVWEAAHSNRREIHVGIPTVYTILGEKLAPGLVDRYLAKTAVSSQLTEPKVDPPREGNLFEPSSEDQGTHGRYDEQAHAHSVQYFLTKHRRSTLGALTAVAGGAVAAVSLLRR